jgi:NADPH:quinone reductase-like Zn-dependent oxidoreductase
MKAIRMHTRAGPKALVYEDAPDPEIGLEEALVKVHAAGITPTEFTWNSTFTTISKKSRLPIIPAFEVAGTVEKVGSKVSGLSEGEAVYGLLDFWRDGAAAEFAVARATDLAPMPRSLSFTYAAAIPLSALVLKVEDDVND